MAMVTITADSSNKSFQSLSLERSTTARDASFSSYLNASEQIAEKSRRLKSFSATPDDRLHLRQKNKSEYEGGIDVFTADKYFNEAVGEMSPNIVNKDDPSDISSLKHKIQPRTPSVRSVSSWNSRSSLLNTQKTDQQPKKTNRTKSFLASIGCRCSCSDEFSVNVDNQSNEGKSKGYMNQSRRPNSNTWFKEDRLIKKIDDSKHLVVHTQDRVRHQVSNLLHDQEECARRSSLEVFGSPIQTKGGKSSDQVGKLAWVASIAKEAETEEIPADPNEKYNDTDSDVSSDLFEIESFSPSTNMNPSLTRQASDGMSAGCVSPTTCYAPSEVSIQWSIVTESMADFSVMSDSEDLEITATSKTRHSLKQTTNRDPGILSGCKSYKAVRVAGDTHGTTDKAFIQDFEKQQQKMEASKQTTRFYTELKIDTTRKDIQDRFTTHSAPTMSKFKRGPHLLHIH